jgi:hypothetical protein
MSPTLTLQEEELARNLKSQGKSTQEIMSAIAQRRTQSIIPQRTEQTPIQNSTAQRVLSDIPSDFMEMGRGVKQSVADSGQQLRGALQDPTANPMMKLAATGPILGKSVLDVAGESIVGIGKMATTDEFEKAVVQKIGETGQAAMDTKTAKSLVSWFDKQDDQSKFMIKNVFFPAGEVMFEGATLGAGSVASRAGKEAVEQGIKKAGQEIGDTAASVIRQTPDAPIVAPVPPDVKQSVVSAFDTAIKPNLTSKQTPLKRAQYETQVAQGLESIAENVENLRFVDDATGEVVTGRLPQNLKELVDGLEQTKQAIFKQYDELAEKAGEVGAKIDTVRVANELDDIINSRSLKLSNPEAIKYAEDVRARLLATRSLSAADAQDVIRNYNNSLDAFYRNPTPEGLTRNAVDAMVANQLRKMLDDEIGAMTGANYQALKRQYGSLKAIERDVMRAYNRDARRNQKGLIDFTDVLTGGQVVGGILSMNPAAIGQGIAGKAIAGAIKMINDPNRKVKQIFSELGKYRRPSEGMRTPSRKQLPPARPNAPRSEVSSGRAVEAGGETPRGRVETGITERTKEGAIRRSDSERTASPLEEALARELEELSPADKKKLKLAGVDVKELSILLAAGGGGYYLLDQMGTDGEFYAAGIAILGVGISKAGKLKMLDDGIKANMKRAEQAREAGDTRMEKILEAQNKTLVREYSEVRDSLSPGLTTKDISKDPSFNKGATPNLTTDPDLRTNRAVPMKDVAGQKFTVPANTVIKPKLNEKGNAVITVDGKSYTVPKNQYDNLKGQSTRAVASEFAPELKGTVETVKRNNNLEKEIDDLLGSPLGAGMTRAEARDLVEITPDATNAPKYSQYTLDGGENYREILIQAPLENGKVTRAKQSLDELKKDGITFEDDMDGMSYPVKDGEAVDYDSLTARQRGLMDTAIGDATDTASFKNNVAGKYQSSHWSEPNVISHIRMNERTIDGKKYAFMEELQSDWARDARTGKDTPNNPLLKDWQIPTTKRALIEAVDSGADRFAWINGEQTSARYNLATHLDDVSWEESFGGRKIFLTAKEGRKEIDITTDSTGEIISTRSGGTDWNGKKLDEVLGKGLADKIMEKETGTLSGDGLSFGGEWAKNLYDRQVRDIVKKLTGAEVKTVDMGLGVGKEERYKILGSNTFASSKNVQKGDVVTDKLKEDYFVINRRNNGEVDLIPAREIRLQLENDYDLYNKYYPKSERNGEFVNVSKEEMNDAYYQAIDDGVFAQSEMIKTVKLDDVGKQTQQYIDLTPEVKAKIQSKAPKFKMKDGVNVAMPLILAYFYVESE